MSIVRARRSGSGGGTSSSLRVSHLSDGLYTTGSPAIPDVSQTFVLDVTANLTTLAGVSYTTGSGITGLTEGSLCEIETTTTINNIAGQTTIYLELINALDNANRYLRRNMVVNKLDADNSGTIKFNFVVTAEMATDGLRVAMTGHRGTSGTEVFDFIHTIKEHL